MYLLVLSVLILVSFIFFDSDNKYINQWKRRNNYNNDLFIQYWYNIPTIFSTSSPHYFLECNFPFYRKLTSKQQNVFLKRCIAFRNYHRFEYKLEDTLHKREIELLVSATAIQLTFGLNGFMLPFFNPICILPTEYYTAKDGQLTDGHVTRSGILYLAWSKILYGIQVSNDKQNVALHEFAHALYIQCFDTVHGGDIHFTENFNSFKVLAVKAIETNKYNPHYFLGQYALTNFHEYWAVCVEVFFEEPNLIYNTDRNLYNVLSNLLKQNPIVQV